MLTHCEDSAMFFLNGHTICYGETLDNIAKNRFLRLPDAKKLCGTEGFARLSLKDLSHLDQSFRSFYGRPVKVWTDWRRLNGSHFYRKNAEFKVNPTELCSTVQFAYNFFGTVAISKDDGRFVLVSDFPNHVKLFF